MRIPEFTADASLGGIREHYVVSSGYMARRSIRSLQPQLHRVSTAVPCELAWIECLATKNCQSYYQCLSQLPQGGGGGGGGNGGVPPWGYHWGVQAG
jgi:hypothetical protein